MKKTKDILIVLVLGILLVILVWVGIVAITRLNKDASAKVDANQCEQISQLNAKIDSLENMIMRGQKPKNTSVKVDANQRELKSQLRLENDDLKNQLKSQLDFMERQIEYEEKVVDDLEGNITFWFCFVTIVVTIIAIAVPLYNMSEIKGKQKEVEDKQKEVEDKQKEVEDKQKEIEDKQKKSKVVIEKQTNDFLNSVKKELERVKVNTNAFILFMQAIAERKNHRQSLFYCNYIIDNLKTFSGISDVYFLRGCLKWEKAKGGDDYKNAIGDFDKAIKIRNGEVPALYYTIAVR